MNNCILKWHEAVARNLTGHLPDPGKVFGLRQCGAAKYVDGVAGFGDLRLDPKQVVNAATQDSWPAHDVPALSKSSIHTMMMGN